MVRDDGSESSPEGRKPRLLLSLLACRPNELVTAERLADELWEGEPPPTAAAALRVHIGAVRRSLEPDRGRTARSDKLPAVGSSYRLFVTPDELDSLDFERAVVTARESLADGDVARATAAYARALAMWSGPMFADTATLAALAGEIARLDELRANAFSELGECRLSIGDHAGASEVLGEGVELYPLDERMTEQLMLARYRSGRPAEALEAYVDLKRRLDEELGVQPRASARDLEMQILLHAPELAWTPPAAARTAPAPLAPRFVGRRAELDALATALRAAEAAPQVAMVRGPAGIGKSTFIERFAADVERAGGCVTRTHCRHDAGAPYAPLAGLMRRDAERPPPGTDAVASAQLAESIVSQLTGARTGVHVLVMEDVHWIDAPSARVLRALLRDPDLSHVLVILSVRDDEWPEDARSRFERMLDVDNTTFVDLHGFDRDEVRAFVRSIAVRRSAPGLLEEVETLHGVTDGNPLYVREVVQGVVDDDLAGEPLRTFINHNAPRGVRDLVGRRVNRLPAEAQRFLRSAAVIGQQFDLRIVAAASGLSSTDLAEALHDAVDARVVDHGVGDAHAQFRHAILRHAILDGIAPDALAECHARAARAIESIPESERSTGWAELAAHYEHAGAAGDGRGAECARRAGDHAIAQYAWEDAARWYRVALEGVAFRGLGRAEIELQFGRALLATGATDEAAAVFAAASATAAAAGDRTIMARAAIANLGTLALPNFRVDQIRLVEDAVAYDGSLAIGDHVRLLDAVAMTAFFSDERREQLAVEEAERVASGASADAHAVALGARRRALTHHAGAARERLAASRAMVALDLPVAEQLRARWNLLTDLLEVGELREFDAEIERFSADARAWRQPLARYHAAALTATRLTASGRYDAAEQKAEAARELGARYGIPDSLGAYVLHVFMIRLAQGRLAELPVKRQRDAGPDHSTPAGLALGALTLCEVGHPDRARPLVAQLTVPSIRLPRDGYRLAGLALLAWVGEHLDDSALLGKVGDAMDAVPDDQLVVFGAGGAILGVVGQWRALCLARSGDTAGAAVLLRDAADRLEALDMPFWLSRARRDLERVRQ